MPVPRHRGDGARGRTWGRGTSAIQKFDLFERRLRTARRRDGGQIGGIYSGDGENEGEKKKEIKVRRRISLPASRRPHMCDTSLGGRRRPSVSLSLFLFFEASPSALSLSRLSTSSTGSDRAKIKGCKVMREYLLGDRTMFLRGGILLYSENKDYRGIKIYFEMEAKLKSYVW